MSRLVISNLDCENMKIGIVVEDVTCMVVSLPKDKVVLMRQGSNLHEYVVMFPYTKIQIENAGSNAHNFTYGTIVGVPERYIREILI